MATCGAYRHHSYPKYLLHISKSMVAFSSFLPPPLTSTPSCSLAPPPFLATYSSVDTAILAMVSLCSALLLLLPLWFLYSLPCHPSSPLSQIALPLSCTGRFSLCPGLFQVPLSVLSHVCNKRLFLSPWLQHWTVVSSVHTGLILNMCWGDRTLGLSLEGFLDYFSLRVRLWRNI